MATCAICHRPLSDRVSIQRGIGPDCWAEMQARIEDRKASGGDATVYLPYQPGEGVILRRVGEWGKTVNVPRVYVHHSPDGFEWGYGGSGPADLAYNILLLFTDANTVQQHYQDFKWEFIASMPKEGGTISETVICAWLSARTADLFTPSVSQKGGSTNGPL